MSKYKIGLFEILFTSATKIRLMKKLYELVDLDEKIQFEIRSATTDKDRWYWYDCKSKNQGHIDLLRSLI